MKLVWIRRRRPSFSKDDFRDVFGFYPGDPNSKIEATKVELRIQGRFFDFRQKAGRVKAVSNDYSYSDDQLRLVVEERTSSRRSWNRACELAESFGYHVPSLLKPGFRKSA